MRAVPVGAAGLAISLGAHALSRTMDGLPGAALFVLSLFVAPVVIGIAIASIWNPGAGRILAASQNIRRRHLTPITRRRSLAGSRCRECGGRRQVRSDVWVCGHCDLGVALPEFG